MLLSRSDATVQSIHLLTRDRPGSLEVNDPRDLIQHVKAHVSQTNANKAASLQTDPYEPSSLMSDVQC